MNQNLGQAAGDAVSSQKLLFGNFQRTLMALALLAAIPVTATAQYGGGGAGSYGSKGAAIGGVAAGAAAGAGLLYWKLHHKAKLEGCVVGNGDKLVNEKDSQTYRLTN